MMINMLSKNSIKQGIDVSGEQEESFADRVRQLRKLKGWTLDQLSEYSKVSGPTLSKIENGTNPRFDTVIRLAKAFGVSTDYLAGIDNLTVPEIARTVGLEEVAIDNIYRAYQSGSLIDEEHFELNIDEPAEGYVPSYMPGFCPEKAFTDSFHYLLHEIDIIATRYGERTVHNILSPEGIALLNRYKGSEGGKKLLQFYVNERMKDGYLNYADHFVANRILSDWKLFRMIANYIRSFNATEAEGLVKIEETDYVLKSAIMTYLDDLRDSMKKEPPFAVPCFSDEDTKSIENTFNRISRTEVDKIEWESVKGDLKYIFDKDDPLVKELLGDDKK